MVLIVINQDLDDKISEELTHGLEKSNRNICSLEEEILEKIVANPIEHLIRKQDCVMEKLKRLWQLVINSVSR